MTATEVLKTEHSAIRVMLDVLNSIADQLEQGRPVDTADLDAILDFVRVFADSCHHAKEEDLLFPALERAGLPRDGGPVGVMLAEHETGRAYIRALAEGVARLKQGDAGAASEAARNARGYADLLDAHIYKEDNVLYEIADMHLSAEEQDCLVKEFDRVEEERVGHGRHEQFHELLHSLGDRYLS